MELEKHTSKLESIWDDFPEILAEIRSLDVNVDNCSSGTETKTF